MHALPERHQGAFDKNRAAGDGFERTLSEGAVERKWTC